MGTPSVQVLPFWDLVEKASDSRMGRGRSGLDPGSPLAFLVTMGKSL